LYQEFVKVSLIVDSCTIWPKDLADCFPPTGTAFQVNIKDGRVAQLAEQLTLNQ